MCWADHTAQRFVTAASARNITVVRVDDGHAETIPAPGACCARFHTCVLMYVCNVLLKLGRVSDLASAPAKQRLVALTQVFGFQTILLKIKKKIIFVCVYIIGTNYCSV